MTGCCTTPQHFPHTYLYTSHPALHCAPSSLGPPAFPHLLPPSPTTRSCLPGTWCPALPPAYLRKAKETHAAQAFRTPAAATLLVLPRLSGRATGSLPTAGTLDYNTIAAVVRAGTTTAQRPTHACLQHAQPRSTAMPCLPRSTLAARLHRHIAAIIFERKPYALQLAANATGRRLARHLHGTFHSLPLWVG